MHRVDLLLLPWMALVALAPWATADEAELQPSETRSALVLSHSGTPIPSDAQLDLADHESEVEAPHVAQQPVAQQPLAEQPAGEQPADSGESLLNPADRPEILDGPPDAFHGFPDPFAPAPAVSSSNWLRSCCWYTEQSVVYMTRTPNVKNDVVLAGEFVFGLRTNILDVALDAGFEPGLRSTLGRYLGRDARNRTHAVEFTFLGLTHWQAGESLPAENPGTLFQQVNPLIAVPVYDQSDVQAFDLTSDFNSYEFNYRIERRLGRDRIVYSRNSRWVREATPTLLCSAFAGIRTLFVNERIDWTASSTLGNGRYVVVTHNNMVGPQVGSELFYERAYWRAGAKATAGALVNWASQSSKVNINQTNGDPLVTRDESAKQHTLAFAGGLNFVGEYRFRPTFGLRVSYDLMWVTELALAQNQLTFLPSTPPQISDSHTLFFQGVTLGFEWFR